VLWRAHFLYVSVCRDFQRAEKKQEKKGSTMTVNHVGDAVASTRVFGVPNHLPGYDLGQPLAFQVRNNNALVRTAAYDASVGLAQQQKTHGEYCTWLRQTPGEAYSPYQRFAALMDKETQLTGGYDANPLAAELPGEEKLGGNLWGRWFSKGGGKYAYSRTLEETAQKILSPAKENELRQIQRLLMQRYGSKIPPYFSRALEAAFENIAHTV
jgi:hypothetical protein